MKQDDYEKNIRDMFAAMALQGLVVGSISPFKGDLMGMHNKAAETAYILADAMMEARKK